MPLFPGNERNQKKKKKKRGNRSRARAPPGFFVFRVTESRSGVNGIDARASVIETLIRPRF